MNNIFITGISSGIGKALAQFYAHKGVSVFGISRRELDYNHTNIHHIQLDMTDFKNFKKLKSFIPEKVDLCILNAGVLGEMKSMTDSNLSELKSVMDINLWAQKEILDVLLQKKIQNILAISSGAAINGGLGWSGYSLSKAALNMLIQLYSKEYPTTKFISFAPGLVDTAMQDYLCEKVDSKKFQSVQRLKSARGTSAMPTADEFAKLFDQSYEKVISFDSGSFVDIRQL